MKQSITLILSILFAAQAFGQSNKVTSTWNHLRHGELKQAKEAIDAAVEHEDTREDAKAWFYRGNTYFSLDTAKKEKFASLAENPKNEAVKSYQKALELDDNDRYKRKIQRKMINLGVNFFQDGANAYNSGNKLRKKGDTSKAREQFQQSLMHFENYFLARKLAGQFGEYIESTLRKYDIDPNLIFLYAGYSANQVEKFEEAKKYLNQLVKMQTEKAPAYLTLSDVYLKTNDTTKALEILDKGQEVLPDNNSLQNKKLRIYQLAGRVDELIENLKASIEKNPDDLQLYRILANTYEKLSKEKRENDEDDKAKEYKDKARQTYEDLLKKDPDNFKANYNVGVMLYNFGVDKIKKSQDIDDYEKVMTLEERAKKDFEKAIPYLEKAFRKNCGDENLFKSLKNIYSRTDNDEKFDRLKNAYNNNKIRVVVQGDAEDATIAIMHSGKTLEYMGADLSTSFSKELCPFDNKVTVKIKGDSPNATIKFVKGGETVKQKEGSEAGYKLK